MSRFYTKPLATLASDRMHLLGKMSPLKLLETLEDVSAWKDRNSVSKELFRSCCSRLVAQLPDLKVSEISRLLFSYRAAGIEAESLVQKVVSYLLDETWREESLFRDSSVNDILLLYKGLERNGVFDPRVHGLLVREIAKQRRHMIVPDLCLFLRSHSNYLLGNETAEARCGSGDGDEARVGAPDSLLFPEIVNECIERIFSSEIKSLHLVGGVVESLAIQPARFDVNQIMSLVQSCCKILHVHEEVCWLSQRNFPGTGSKESQGRRPIEALITSLLRELERRGDIPPFRDCLESFYHLNGARYWDPELMKGMLYCITNRVTDAAEARRVLEITIQNVQGSEERGRRKGGEEDEENRVIRRREWAATVLEYGEILERLKRVAGGEQMRNRGGIQLL